MSKSISSALQIKETTDFSKFELIEGNRPINWKKVQRMREAIRRPWDFLMPRLLRILLTSPLKRSFLLIDKTSKWTSSL